MAFPEDKTPVINAANAPKPVGLYPHAAGWAIYCFYRVLAPATPTTAPLFRA
jgi:hypothetical protein